MNLVDPFGRRITGLRMAVTPRCNLRCIYCHHEGERAIDGELSCEMATGIIRAASDLGIRSLKITGGEPLIRHDLEEIIAGAHEALPGLDISITTNGTLLAGRAERLAEAGLSRANISLPSLEPERYRAITRSVRGPSRVLAGIDSAIDAGLDPIKLNMVVLRENEDEIQDMIDLSSRKGVILQLIELLDLAGTGAGADLARVEEALARRAERTILREMHRRKKYILDGAEVEVVRPIDNTEFCRHCNRMRVTSDGKLKPCLLRNDNLVEIGSSDPEEIKRLFVEATARRAPFFSDRTLADCDARRFSQETETFLSRQRTRSCRP